MMSYYMCCLLLILEGVLSVFNVQITNGATLFAIVGDSIVVNCNITGSYQSINWYAGNTVLSNGQKYQIINSTSNVSTFVSLVITDVEYGDAARYMCQAVSSIDGTRVASDTVTLSVGDKDNHHLEADSRMLTYIVTICVLLAIIFIMAIFANMERIKKWWNILAVAIKEYFDRREIFNDRNSILTEVGTGIKDSQRENYQEQMLLHPIPDKETGVKKMEDV